MKNETYQELKNKLKKSYIGQYRTIYKLEEKNKLGESLTIEVYHADYKEIINNDNCLPRLWVENGYTKHLYVTALHIDAEIKDKDGNCWRKYEPTSKLSGDGKRLVIDFDWLLEDTKENEEKLLIETIKRFMEAC